MLAALTLAAVLTSVVSDVPGPVLSAALRTSCPTLPTETIVPSARICDVLEVTGRVDPASLTLDPAFDSRAPELEMARPAPGPASVTAYDAKGQAIFAFPFEASGAFRLVLPIGKQAAASIARLTLSAGGATFERVAASNDEPGAEAISADDGHVVFAWNAREFPGVRISSALDGTPVANVIGTQTYEQINVKSRATRLVVSFSNGVRSFTRTVPVFGR